MRPVGKPHYLPHNKITWSPPAVAYIKTITEPIPGSDPEVLALTGWFATIRLRRDVKPGKPIGRTAQGRTAKGLAEWLTEHTRGRDTVWVFTHNASLDLITTRLPLELHSLEWDVNDASLSGSAPWVRLGRGSRRMAIVDSFSYLPHTAADLAERLGTPYPHRDRDETDHEWAVRSAEFDLRIVDQAMTQLLDWWDEHALGKWSISGASTGWHAMRHVPSPFKVVIDPDPAHIKADRQAIYGGRRGAWVVGTRTLGPFLELDFTNAYPSVAVDLPLPSRRGPAFDSLALDHWQLTSERWGIIADCRIVSSVSRWPVRFPGGTFCPVGTFHTTLAGPEIRDALRLGCLQSVGRGHLHQLGSHMSPWAQWVIAVLRNTSGDEPVPAQLFAKATSRSVIGKWASRSYERIPLGLAPNQGWGYTECWDHETQTRGANIDIAGQRWWSGVSGDAEQAYPAVLAWVESETRVRLTRVIEAIGEGAVLQCDTDGLIVAERIIGKPEARGHLRAPTGLAGAARTKWVLDNLDPIIAPLTIRIKRKHKTIRVLGPQHVHTPADRSFAGLPRMAQETSPDVYTYKQWPGLPFQLGHGSDAGYVRPETSVRINGPYAPGWVLTDGRVIPIECTIRDDGTNRIIGWDDMTTKPDRAKRAHDQHPILAALW